MQANFVQQTSNQNQIPNQNQFLNYPQTGQNQNQQSNFSGGRGGCYGDRGGRSSIQFNALSASNLDMMLLIAGTCLPPHSMVLNLSYVHTNDTTYVSYTTTICTIPYAVWCCAYAIWCVLCSMVLLLLLCSTIYLLHNSCSTKLTRATLLKLL